MNSKTERSIQYDYWQKYSIEGSVVEIMLDTQALSIDALERPEILGALGSVHGKSILEMGAGIGRFTSSLAEDAHHVTACDFMRNSMEKNQVNNRQYTNITFLPEDAMQLTFEEDTFDVIFSNWLFMYLSDAETEVLFQRALTWLRVGGVLFFRESCYQPAGDRKRESNPSHYRGVSEYFSFVDKICLQDQNGKCCKYELIRCGNVHSYIKIKSNHGQLYWKFKKIQENSAELNFRQFLDHSQYSKKGVLRYEKIFGDDYISTGGRVVTEEILKKVSLSPGQYILDIGSGIGGGTFYLADHFKANVIGMDLSVNVFTIAIDRACRQNLASKMDGHVFFELSNCMTREFESESFDFIFSKDALLHISQKEELFRRMLSWLKPGGQLLITDYCRSENEPSKDFAEYIKERGYVLYSIETYGEMLRMAGLVDVVAEDMTEKIFIPTLQRELEKMTAQRNEFSEEFSEDDYLSLVNGWNDKLVRSTAGEQRYGFFYGRRPMN